MLYKNLFVLLVNRKRKRKYKKSSKNFHIMLSYIFKKRNRLIQFFILYNRFHKYFNNYFIFSKKNKKNNLYNNRIISGFNKIFFNLFYLESNHKDYYFSLCVDNNIKILTKNSKNFKLLIN